MPIFGSYDTAEESYKKKYDSDQDLTPEERRKIKFARNPDAVRKNIWANKDTSSRLMRMMQAGLSGDIRNKE